MRVCRAAAGARRPERRSERVARLSLELDAGAVYPVREVGTTAVFESLQRFRDAQRRNARLAKGGEVGRQSRQELHVLFPASQGVIPQLRADREQGLGKRMPAFRRWNVGPEQIDQPIARNRARPSLEMQVQQDGEVFLR